MARRPFGRARGGTVVVALHPREAELLARTAHDMVTVVQSPPDGDVRDRLYPRAYLDPTEETAQQEYDSLVHDDLVQARRTALEVVGDALAAAVAAAASDTGHLVEIALAPGEELQWLTALNDARLIIGTLLGLTEEDDGEYAREDPRFEPGVLYQWLTALQFELLEVLMDELGEAGSEDRPEPPSP